MITKLKSLFFLATLFLIGQSSIGQTPQDPTNKFVKSTFIDNRDGQHYRLVRIGNKTWFAENLNYVTDSSYCYNDSCKSCGRLYKFKMALQACPEGTHLPTESEWDSLCFNLGGKKDINDDATYFSTIKGMLTNESIINLKYCGFFRQNPFSEKAQREFDLYDTYSAYWSSTIYNDSIFIGRHMELNSTWFGTVHGNKNSGLSIRCVLDR